MLTLSVLSEAPDFATLAACLREVADEIEKGHSNARRGEYFDYAIVHGANLDLINRILCDSPEFAGLRVAFNLPAPVG